MALSDLNRVLRAFFSKLGTDDQKRLIEELGAETLNIHFNEIWTDDIDPDPAQAIIDGVAESRTLFALTEDVTVANKEAWRAIDTGTPLIDWIPPGKFGDSYITNLYDGSNNLITLATQIVQGMVFDHKTGILTINGDPNLFTHPFKVSGYRYIGQKGGTLGGGSPTEPGDLFSCPSGVSVGDAVYIDTDDTVNKAFAGAVGQTPDAIGIVLAKPSSITCRVLGKGLSGAIFSGLTTGLTYYVSDSIAGAITSTAPTSSGAKVQEVGQAASTTRLFIDVDSTSIEL